MLEYSPSILILGMIVLFTFPERKISAREGRKSKRCSKVTLKTNGNYNW